MPHQAVSVLDGSTFVVSDRRGDMRPRRAASTARLLRRGHALRVALAAERPGAADRHPVRRAGSTTSSRSSSSSRRRRGSTPRRRSGIVRQRLVGDAWLEDVVVVNHRDEHVAVAVDAGGRAPTSPTCSRSRTTTSAQRPIVARASPTASSSCATATATSCARRRSRSASRRRSTRTALRLNLWLAPREERRDLVRRSRRAPTEHDRTEHARAPARRQRSTSCAAERSDELDAWIASGSRDSRRRATRCATPTIAASPTSPRCASTRTSATQDVSLPAAGLPWFMTLFGRDSLITSYQALPFRPELAAHHPDDARRPPGHRSRRLPRRGAGQDPPRAPLRRADGHRRAPALALLRDRRRDAAVPGPARRVRALDAATPTSSGRSSQRPARRSTWIDRYGDLDGDGYVEYQTAQPAERAGQPVLEGLVELDPVRRRPARRRARSRRARSRATCTTPSAARARLAREVWDDPALRRAARRGGRRRCARASCEDFWMPGRGVLRARARRRQAPRSTASRSNIGHLLWSGIVDDARAGGDRGAPDGRARCSRAGACGRWPPPRAATTRSSTTTAPCGRTTTRSSPPACAGYGHHDAAARDRRATAPRGRATSTTGCPRSSPATTSTLTHAPVEYPTASSPQAWAAGAPLLLLTTVLGLSPGPDGIGCDPHLPAAFGDVVLTGLRGRWGRADITANGAGQIIA